MRVYYLPKDYFGLPYFYSPKYLQTYYNGYGYNFYTGEFNYYEDSPPAGNKSNRGNMGTLYVILTISFAVITMMGGFILKAKTVIGAKP